MSAFISLPDAVRMTSTYRVKRPTMLDASLPVETLPTCETFQKEHVEMLLSKPECTGLRAYLGTDEEGMIKILLVAVNSDDEDIYLEDNSILDRANRCPYMCPPASPLNI